MDKEILTKNNDLMINEFIKNHERHVALVEEYAKKIVKSFSFLEDLLIMVKNHDVDKIKDEFLIKNFAILLFIDRNLKAGFDIDYSEFEEDIKKAILLHKSQNYYYPEFWDKYEIGNVFFGKNKDKFNYIVDASLMDDISIAEMVCDWVALTEEAGENIYEFIEENVGTKWFFDSYQKDLINTLVAVLKQ